MVFRWARSTSTQNQQTRENNCNVKLQPQGIIWAYSLKFKQPGHTESAAGYYKKLFFPYYKLNAYFSL